MSKLNDIFVHDNIIVWWGGFAFGCCKTVTQRWRCNTRIMDLNFFQVWSTCLPTNITHMPRIILSQAIVCSEMLDVFNILLLDDISNLINYLIISPNLMKFWISASVFDMVFKTLITIFLTRWCSDVYW